MVKDWVRVVASRDDGDALSQIETRHEKLAERLQGRLDVGYQAIDIRGDFCNCVDSAGELISSSAALRSQQLKFDLDLLLDRFRC